MTYKIPETVKLEWKKQAQSTGMAYSTVVGQHVYDIEGLVEVLKQQLEQSTNALKTVPANSPEYEQVDRKIANLKAKLDHAEQQLAAYQAEQNQPEADPTPS